VTAVDLIKSRKEHRAISQQLTVATRKIAALEKSSSLLTDKYERLKSTNHSNNTSKNS
jgi:hypothetical protein